MTSAPVEITGRNSRRYTVSVVDVLSAWACARVSTLDGRPSCPFGAVTR